MNKLDWKFFFFAWWENETYILDSDDILPQFLIEYFDKLELEIGIKLKENQKQWYYSKYKTQKENMYSEYPSTPDEAFKASVEGAYYQKQIMKIYEDGRIGFVPHDKKVLVDVYWDLGRNDLNVLLFVQSVGKEIRFIDVYFNRGEGLAHYANILRQKRDDLGYNYRFHYLPWDVEITELSTNKTRLDTLRDLGVTGIRVVPKLSIQEGIEMTRNIFNRFWIDSQKCDRLVQAIINYRQEWDDKLGTYKSYPRHDDHSHFADALRSIGVCFLEEVYIEKEANKPVDKYGLFAEI